MYDDRRRSAYRIIGRIIYFAGENGFVEKRPRRTRSGYTGFIGVVFFTTPPRTKSGRARDPNACRVGYFVITAREPRQWETRMANEILRSFVDVDNRRIYVHLLFSRLVRIKPLTNIVYGGVSLYFARSVAPGGLHTRRQCLPYHLPTSPE